jgi:hypothetical protein
MPKINAPPAAPQFFKKSLLLIPAASYFLLPFFISEEIEDSFD